MERLTHERVNGIKEGYWSAAKKEDLVQRLAQYENTGLNPEEIMDLAKMGGCEGADSASTTIRKETASSHAKSGAMYS